MTNRLTEGKIGPTLLRFALPFMLANLLQALYGAADLFVVGQFADSAAVSAVSTGSQIMQFITYLVLGFSMGGTVLIGNCIGAKDDDGAAKAIGTLAVTFAAAAVVLTGAMLFLYKPAVALMNTPAEAVEYAQQYVFICTLGIPFIIGYNVVSGIFRGMGDSKTPVYFIAIACVVNIVADVVLVKFFHMGAAGAAIATSVSQAISFICSLIYMARKGFSFKFTKLHIRIDKYSLSRICRVGLPIAIQDSLTTVSFMIITAIINGMGLVASASVGVVEKIIGFAMLPPAAFSSAVATMTSQNIGAGKPERAYSAMKFGILYSLVFGVAVFAYANILPETLTGIFSNDADVIASAASYLRSYSFDCVLVSFVFSMNAYFTGSGRAVISMAHSIVATFLVRIPLSYLFSRMETRSLFEMGIAAPAATVLSVLVCVFFLIRIRKREGAKKQTAVEKT